VYLQLLPHPTVFVTHLRIHGMYVYMHFVLCASLDIPVIIHNVHIVLCEMNYDAQHSTDWASWLNL